MILNLCSWLHALFWYMLLQPIIICGLSRTYKTWLECATANCANDCEVYCRWRWNVKRFYIFYQSVDFLFLSFFSFFVFVFCFSTACHSIIINIYFSCLTEVTDLFYHSFNHSPKFFTIFCKGEWRISHRHDDESTYFCALIFNHPLDER